MIKLPLSVLLAMAAFNVTAFAVVLQLDMLVINSVFAKTVSWLVTIAAWVLVYVKRNKFVTLF